MGQELIIPSDFNTPPAQAFAGLNPHEDNLAEGIGQSYGVIGYKGKVWSLRHRGERHNIVRPDDGTPASYIDVVILSQAANKSKSFYKKYEPGSSDGERPICSSLDGVTPDPEGDQFGKTVCALCPRNAWKTDPNTGRKGRDCQDYKRLAVLIIPSQTAPIFGGQPLVEPMFLRVPPASLNALAIMGETMTNKGYHYTSYVTRISFDANEAHPKMIFTPLQKLTDKEGPFILELRGSPTTGRITGGEIALPAPAATTIPQGSSAATILPPSTLAAASPTSTTGLPSATMASALPVIDIGLAAPDRATAASPTASMVDTGFGDVGTLGAQPVQSSPSSAPGPALQLPADTGSTASDDELDAQITALLKTS